MKRIVIKIGSSFFINSKNEVNRKNILKLVNQIAILQEKGISCCLVSSGAIAVGVKKIGLTSKPADLGKKQACAAIGQMTLMQEYEQIFSIFDMQCAQILLNHDDLGNRNRVMTLKNTMEKLFQMKVVPIVNENDALAVEEIKVGDNDTLSAITSMVIDADMLVLVSDIDGLYSSDPKLNLDAKLIDEVEGIDDSIRSLAGGVGSEFGTGGMSTKIKAGEIATNSGIPMMIINKTFIEKLSQVSDGVNLGTIFREKKNPLSLRNSWIKYCANVKGRVYVDNGAKNAIINRKSLLSCGITSFEGQFIHGEVIEIYCEDKIVAKGVAMYNASELKKIIKQNNVILVHANSMVIIGE